MRIKDYGSYVEIHDFRFKWPHSRELLLKHLNYWHGRLECNCFLILHGDIVLSVLLSKQMANAVEEAMNQLDASYEKHFKVSMSKYQ